MIYESPLWLCIFKVRPFVQHPRVPGIPVAKGLGIQMRKGTLLIAVLFAAMASTAADAAKKKAAPAAPADAALANQEKSFTFMRDAMQPWNTKLSTPAAAQPAKAKAKPKAKKKAA
jgi:hypothetical protein